LLREGARFNEELHRLPDGQRTGIVKGVYRFRTHEAANRHREDCLVVGIMLNAGGEAYETLTKFAEAIDVDGRLAIKKICTL